MQKTALSMLTLSMLCLSATVWAAGAMKPGLWEMTIKSDAMKSMPKIPPEQMQKMREMGINMPQMQDGGMVTTVCISKEMAAREQPPEMNHKESGCQSKNFQRTGSSYSVDVICDGPHLKGEGKAKGTFSDAERFSTTYDFKGSAQGHPVNQHHESSGKWVGADCGNVKTVEEMMPKR
jgi:hypothetical protein